MKIQAYLTAAAINLKRLASFFFALLFAILTGMLKTRGEIPLQTIRS